MCVCGCGCVQLVLGSVTGLSGLRRTGHTGGVTALSQALPLTVPSPAPRLQGINGKLSNVIRELSTNTAMGIGGACGGAGARKTVIVMDEVDGMSGSDRGGIGDLIKIIAKSKVPPFPPLFAAARLMCVPIGRLYCVADTVTRHCCPVTCCGSPHLLFCSEWWMESIAGHT